MASPNPISSLANVLKMAVEKGDSKKAIKSAIAIGMGSQSNQKTFSEFHELLRECKKAIQKLDRNISHSQVENIKMIEDLELLFITHNFWSDPWGKVVDRIKRQSLSVSLDNLGMVYNLSYPSIEVDKEFLSKLIEMFSDIRKEVMQSNLTKDLKSIVLEHIDEICYAIDNYPTHGRDGILSALSASLGNIISNPISSKLSKRNPLVRKFLISVCAVNAFFHTVGIAADLEGYLLPKFEDINNQISTVLGMEGFPDDIDNLIAPFNTLLTGVQKKLPASEEK